VWACKYCLRVVVGGGFLVLHLITAATRNAIVASTLGLQPPMVDIDNNDMIDNEEAGEVKFEITVTSKSGDAVPPNPLSFMHPMGSGVIVEAAHFDDKKKSVLVVHVPAAGLTSSVEQPLANGKLCMTIQVMRNNRDDIAHQLMPNASVPALAGKQAEIGALLTQSFGKHLTYDVVNKAYHEISPPMETWVVEVNVFEPYTFGSIDLAVVCAPNAVSDVSDVIIVLPLKKEELPEPNKLAKLVQMEDDNVAPVNASDVNK
jgi:hypothetical protein